MRKNTKRKAYLHSAMRQNAISRSGGRGPVVWSVCAALVATFAAGSYFGYEKLHDTWAEQCTIVDASQQLTVKTGAHIKEGLVLELLGLTNGANIAKIDLAAKRREIMEAVPNIRALTVSLHQPDRVEVVVDEREPVARMVTDGEKQNRGRVVDAEGVVFIRQAGTARLPVLIEPKLRTTPSGKRLTGRSAAALRMLCACLEPELSELGFLSVNTSKQDFLAATLGNYSEAVICWEGIDDPPNDTSDAMMRKQLDELRKAVRTGKNLGVKKWNATIQGRVFADTKEPIK